MPNASELHGARVNYSGLMQILGKNLYSTPTVALRELVQNAHDSIIRRRIEDEPAGEPMIRVIPSLGDQTLVIEDTGAGLTRSEIIEFLATVGSGYTGELRSREDAEDLIGAFGLGFLTSYVVSDRVEVWTTSYQTPDKTWHFASKTGEQFTLAESESRPIGTRVKLHLSEEFDPLADAEVVARVLDSYCGLLRVPVYVGESADTPVNADPPPWRRDLGEMAQPQRKRLEREFASNYESFFEPLCTMQIDSPGPAQGMLWVQDGATYGTSDNRNLSIYIRGMLITHDHRDLLPRWAGFVGGVIESAALTPKASREDLIEDETYDACREQVREALINGLAEVARREPAAWRRVLRRHNEALLGAAIADPRLFSLLAEDLTVPTSEGDLTLPNVKKRSDGSIFVSCGSRRSYEETLHRALMIPVVDGRRYGALPFCERYGEERHVQIVKLGTQQGNDEFFEEVEVPTTTRERLEHLFAKEGREIVPSEFEPEYLPCVVMHDEDVRLKERVEADATDERISSAVLGLARDFTNDIDDTIRSRLYVNMSSTAIEKLLTVDDEARAKEASVLVESLATILASSSEVDESDLGETLDRFATAVASLIE